MLLTSHHHRSVKFGWDDEDLEVKPVAHPPRAAGKEEADGQDQSMDGKQGDGAGPGRGSGGDGIGKTGDGARAAEGGDEGSGGARDGGEAIKSEADGAGFRGGGCCVCVCLSHLPLEEETAHCGSGA